MLCDSEPSHKYVFFYSWLSVGSASANFFLMYSFYQRDMKSMDQVLCKMTAVQDRRSYASSSTLNFENVQRVF